ncbi:MAG: hypothetical protein M3Q69_14510 [Acidobacteriota bacterium]|nr:hypothetical protein [Acidobacteriota bacterium]
MITNARAAIIGSGTSAAGSLLRAANVVAHRTAIALQRSQSEGAAAVVEMPQCLTY